jgi:hypothetical protein
VDGRRPRTRTNETTTPLASSRSRNARPESARLVTATSHLAVEPRFRRGEDADHVARSALVDPGGVGIATPHR